MKSSFHIKKLKPYIKKTPYIKLYDEIENKNQIFVIKKMKYYILESVMAFLKVSEENS